MIKKLKIYFLILKYKIHSYKLSRKFKNKKITIISQNCVGGMIYHELKMKFYSPTINMFIENENFLKLCLNPQKYFSTDAIPFIESYVDKIDSSIQYPIIKVNDIELCCLHYKNCRDACDDWNRRRKRINFKKICIIANTWNFHDNYELINKLSSVKYPIVIFTDLEKYKNVKNFIYLDNEKYKKDIRGMVRPNLTDSEINGYKKNYEVEFDMFNWLINI